MDYLDFIEAYAEEIQEFPERAQALLHGRLRWGSSWIEAAKRALEVELPKLDITKEEQQLILAQAIANYGANGTDARFFRWHTLRYHWVNRNISDEEGMAALLDIAEQQGVEYWREGEFLLLHLPENSPSYHRCQLRLERMRDLHPTLEAISLAGFKLTGGSIQSWRSISIRSGNSGPCRTNLRGYHILQAMLESL